MAAYRSRGDGLIGLVVTVLVGAAALAGLIRSVDGTIAGWGMQLAPERDPGDQVVLVSIDDAAVSGFGDWAGLANGLAGVVARVQAADPAVTALALPPAWTGLLMNHWQSSEPLNPGAAAPRPELLLGLYPAPGGVTGTAPLPPRWHPAYFRASRADNLIRDDNLRQDLERRLRFSQPLGRSRLQPMWPDPTGILSGTGFLPAGPAGANAHEPPAVLSVENLLIPALSVHLAARIDDREPSELLPTDSGLQLGARAIPSDAGYHFRPFRYRPRNGETITTVPVADLVNDRIDPTALEGRAVIIGTDSTRWDATATLSGGETAGSATTAARHTAAILQGHLYERPTWGPLLTWGLLALVGLYLFLLLPRLGITPAVVVTLLLTGALFNVQLILPALRLIYLDLATPMLALVTGHGALAIRQVIARRTWWLRQSLSESNRQLGEALKRQGQPHVAFERFMECETSPRLLENLYDLALDLERRRHFVKAQAVLHHLDHRSPGFRDVRQRIGQLTDMAQKSAMAGSGSGPETLVMPENGIEKPMLGRYEIDRELGRGAMGAVYLGRDPRIGRTVAIKTMALAQEFEGQDLERVTDRFYQEAETAGRLNHPNIVTIYDVGEESDLAYIAMDYLDGDGLQNHTEPDTRLPATIVCDIAIQVAEALDYAHGRGVVHRDIKPANMIWDRAAERIVLTDFGVACLTDSSRTKTGTILGTPSYMSPEQVLGRRVDGRSDLYSLGVTMYQLLRGELPFTGEPLATLLYKIANNKAPGVTRQRPDLPPCIGRIVKRALSKDPSDRFQTGEEMAAALRRCRREIEAKLNGNRSETSSSDG